MTSLRLRTVPAIIALALVALISGPAAMKSEVEPVAAAAAAPATAYGMAPAAGSAALAVSARPVALAYAIGEPPEDALRCLALNVYWEARSEPLEGQFAVAAVTLNRLVDPAFPDTVCGVVRQGGERRRHRCQFSWWCDGKKDTPTDETAWTAARLVALASLREALEDPTGGALYYHADYVRPRWAEGMVRTRKIGRHIYYVEDNRRADSADDSARRRSG